MLCRLSYTGLIYYVVSAGLEPATRLRGLPPQGSGYTILPTRPNAGVAYYDQTWILLPSLQSPFRNASQQSAEVGLQCLQAG